MQSESHPSELLLQPLHLVLFKAFSAASYDWRTQPRLQPRLGEKEAFKQMVYFPGETISFSRSAVLSSAGFALLSYRCSYYGSLSPFLLPLPPAVRLYLKPPLAFLCPFFCQTPRMRRLQEHRVECFFDPDCLNL